MPAQPLAACLGDNAVDVYLPPANRSFMGGNAVNTAIALQSAGCSAAYVGCISRDQAGQAIRTALLRRGVDLSHAPETDNPTRRVYTHFLQGGEHRFAHELMEPRVPFQPSAEMLQFARSLRLAHLNWLSDPLEYLAPLTGDGGQLISMDYGSFSQEDFLSQTLPQVDLAFLSLDASPVQAEGVARALRQRGPRLVVLLLGSQGSLAFDGAHLHHQPPEVVEILDTLGAGDAYIGAFLAAYLQDQPLEVCASQAASAAGRVCRVYGAWPGSELPLNE